MEQRGRHEKISNKNQVIHKVRKERVVTAKIMQLLPIINHLIRIRD